MEELRSPLETKRLSTDRLATRVVFSGDPGGTPVLFVHGNLSAATWWEETLQRLPEGFFGVAMDLRGYGNADPDATIDATRGMRDFSDDLDALFGELDIDAAHLVGHSLGGGVLWQFLSDYPHRVISLTQVCPSSPFGFGGSRPDGTPCHADGAGSGAGTVNPEFARLLAEGDRGDETPFHPRSILNGFVWKPPFVPERIEDILTSTLAQQTGEDAYPGDSKPSANWPMVAPGVMGPINAMSPIYQEDPLGFTKGPTPPILWVRGADDSIVSDNSAFELGTLGQAGAVPGWPGSDAFPSQPMIAQTESALQAYEAAGGSVDRVVIPDCGHSPFLEKPEVFDAALHGFLRRVNA